MMLDSQLTFTYGSTATPTVLAAAYPSQVSGAISDAQDLSASASMQVSYNEIDLGCNQTYANGVDGAPPVRSPGNGQPLMLITQIVVQGAGPGTLLITLVAAATSFRALSPTPLIVATSGAILGAQIPAGTLICMPVPPTLGYRYWRVQYTQGTGSDTYTVKSFFSAIAPTPYKYLGPAYLAT